MATFLFPLHLPQQLEIQSLHILQQEPGKSEISNELEQESVKPEELKGSDQLDDNQYLKEETLQQPITEKGIIHFF